MHNASLRQGMSIVGVRSLALCAIAISMPTATAYAQTVPLQGNGIASRDQVVAGRGRSGYQAIGIDVGGFTLFPSATVSTGYDSNIYASSALKVSDGFVVTSPRLTARSQWARHRLTIVADANIRRYFDQTIANSTQYGISADGLIDIGSQTQLSIDSSIGRKVEPRGTEGDTFVGSEPIAYRAFVSNASLQQQIGSLALEVGSSYSTFKYEDAEVGGRVVDLSFRDYTSFGANARVGYKLSASIAPYVSVSYNRATYPSTPTVLDRNSSGYQILGGVALEFTSLLVGRVGIGYISQKFGNDAFSDVSGFSYRASLVWSPTGLTTVTLEGNRALQRGPTVGVAGVVQSDLRVAVDHELLRNLILHGDVGFLTGSYRGIDRSDNRVGGSVSARYSLNRNLALTLSEGYTRQRPGGDVSIGRSYDRHQVLAGLAIQL